MHSVAATVTGSGSALHMRGRAVGVAAAATATALAIVAATASYLALAQNEPIPLNPYPFGGLATWLVLVELAAATSIAAGVWASRAQYPYAAAGLAIASTAVLVPFWATGSWLPAPARAGFLAASPLAVASVSQVALRWGARPPGSARITLRATYSLAAAATLVHLLGYNPFADPGCALVCGDVRPVLDGLLTTRSALTWTCVLTIIAIVVAAGALLRIRGPGAPRPLIIAVLYCLAALTTSTTLRWATWEDPSPPAWRLLVEPLAVAVVGVTVVALALRTMRTRAAVARLAARMSVAETELGSLGGAIRGVQFAVSGDARWVDFSGRDVTDQPPGAEYAVLSDEDEPVLRLLLAERADPNDVLTGLTPASRLALMNARLIALARTRLAEVQDSQRRIVATADAERRRIERDLHDGAQQRLVGAAFHLRAAAGVAEAGCTSRLASAETQVHTALAHLRRLAHGVFPTVLVEEGLEAAIEELASGSVIPIHSELLMPGDVGPEVAMAAYAMIVAVLDSVVSPAAGTRARVSVRTGDAVTVRVEIEGTNSIAPPLDFTDAADRIGAVGGHFTLSGNGGDGYVATAVIPCAS